MNALPVRKDAPSFEDAAAALTDMHQCAISMHMRTTLITRESAKRLAALGGSERALKSIPRRRPRPAK
ncbi:MAG: type II toxin-antitoxin system VapB family antitoxin [Planctomycetota bacterium]